MKNNVCSVEDCKRIGKKHSKTGNYYLLKGMCNMHYQRVINDVKFARDGRYSHPFYRRYRNILSRCYNKNSPKYKNYGGRGITLYDKWRDSMNGFNEFAKYISSLPDAGKPGLSIDRINNNIGYEPGNLRWASASTQNKNRRHFTRKK